MAALKRAGGVLAGLAIVAAAAACGGSTTPASEQSADAQPVSGGVLKVALNAWEPTKLDPQSQGNSNDPLIFRPIFDTLFWQTEDGELEGLLAESADISDDGLTYTFHLRDGVTFHDGAEWTAEGLKLNFEHALDPATQAVLAGSYLAPYQSSEVIDDLTLEVTLSEPYSAFLSVLAQGYLGIISPQQLAEAPETVAENPIGSGPFRFVSWTKGEKIVYERYDDYDWAPESGATHTGPAYLDGLEINFIAEDSVRYNALVAGDVDLIDWTPPQNAQSVRDSENLEFVKFDRPGHPYALWLNESNPPLDDVLVRKGVFAALDREAIVETVSFGEWEVADGFLVPSTPAYVENTNAEFAYDVDQANEFLDEAGWTERDAEGYRVRDGRRLSLYFPTLGDVTQANQIVELAQSQLKAVGVEVVIEVLSDDQQQQIVADGGHHLSAGIWTTNTADVLFIKYHSSEITTPERRGTNQTFTADAELDQLISQGRSTTDTEERAGLYAQAQERLTEIVPSIPLYYRPSLVSYHDYVHDIAFDRAYGNLWFYNTWKDATG
ncbi:ABC transporter substrate-binding protein [Jiangella endophytica]|uniref:ABC transporter substrate-binding protein n=1 Tax=Jiangella endophytica TaxID=1623398 RepID=UPI000E351FFC|nr:ABC transporter substrate-binding protein [Jiangella endophytica]